MKTVNLLSKLFVGISILSVGYVALLSLVSPQATMDLVQVTLPNTDAVSSIRGVYGGVGLAISIVLVYLLVKDLPKALGLLGLFWGGYALSRVITLLVDGPLGAFGTQWLTIEGTFCLIAVGLWWTRRFMASKEDPSPAVAQV
ncbi:MAG: DUF4345 domain-containing protein [Bacteroidota bacterium]